MVFSQINDLYDAVHTICPNLNSDEFYSYLYDLSFLQENRMILAFLLYIIIPGICGLFSIIWIDLVCRFVREGHYLYLLEKRIHWHLKNNQVFTYEHLIYRETKKTNFPIKLNYMFYCVMLGIQILCPITVYCFASFIRNILFVPLGLKIASYLIVAFVAGVNVAYCHRILSYKSK